MNARLAQLAAKPKRVEVEWEDSGGDTGWRSADEVLQSLDFSGNTTCWTCGYIVDERKQSITVASSYHLDPKTGLHSEYHAALTIPRNAIVEIRELRR